MIVPAGLPIEVRGQVTERDHLDALRVVRRRLPSRWQGPVLFLGGPALIVVASLLAGRSLKHALIANLFWIVLGPLMLFLGLPLTTRRTVRFLAKANPGATAPQLYRFTETGFEERECPVEVSIAWSAMTDAVETKTVLLLFGWVDRVMGAIGGVVLALLAYGVLWLLEGWVAFFQRASSPLVPLLFTIIMLAGWVMTLWLLRRRRRP